MTFYPIETARNWHTSYKKLWNRASFKVNRTYLL